MPVPSIAIKSLSIRNFRGIEKLDLDFCGPDGKPNQLVVLAGPNGSGKTSVLEAAILAAGGFKMVTGPQDRRAVRLGAEDYEIRACRATEQGEDEVILRTRPTQAVQGLHFWYFSSWRAPRLVGPMDVTVGKRGRRPSKNDEHRLWDVKQQLVNAAARAKFQSEQPSLFSEHYEDWMKAINQNWSRFYSEQGGRFLVDLVEAGDDNDGAFDVFHEFNDGRRLEVDCLSSGQLELFLFLAALVLNNNREGIIFIDEPELHLDPQWHRPVMNCLRSLQPRAQFLVATHSPEIYDAARSYERHFLVPSSDPRARIWEPVKPIGAGV